MPDTRPKIANNMKAASHLVTPEVMLKKVSRKALFLYCSPTTAAGAL